MGRRDKAVSLFLKPAAPFLLFGHRGFSALAPENTLAAFALLVERGIPGAELDVHLSRDGELVVIHDDDLKRTAGREALVEESGLDEIRGLDAGSWFSPKFRGQKAPLLDEVFELCGQALYYDIELKWGRRRGGGLEEKVIACIKRHRLRDRCLISSFNPYCVRRVQLLEPGLPTAHIFANHPQIPFLLRHGEAGLWYPAPFAKPQSRLIHPLRALFYRRVLKSRLLAWTVDEEQEAIRLVRLGVRGIISNNPGRIRAALQGVVPLS